MLMLVNLLVSAAALVDADGRVLLAQAAPGKPHAGAWEFPGGKVRADETPEAALIRELAEELGVHTEASCLAPLGFATEAMGDRALVLLVFVCRKWRGIARGMEGQALRWADPARLLDMELAAADRPVAAQLRDLLVR